MFPVQMAVLCLIPVENKKWESDNTYCQIQRNVKKVIIKLMHVNQNAKMFDVFHA